MLFGADLDVASEDVKQATTPADHPPQTSSPLPSDLTDSLDHQTPLSQPSLSPGDETNNDQATEPTQSLTNTQTNSDDLVTEGQYPSTDEFEEFETVPSSDELSNILKEESVLVAENIPVESGPQDVPTSSAEHTPEVAFADEDSKAPKTAENTLSMSETEQAQPDDQSNLYAPSDLERDDEDHDGDVPFYPLSETMSESTSTFSMTTIAEVSEEDDVSISESSTLPTSSRDDLDSLPLPARPHIEEDAHDDSFEDQAAESPDLYKKFPGVESDDLSTKCPSLVSISDRTSHYDSTVSITTTDDAYTDEDLEPSERESFLSSVEELTQPSTENQDIEETEPEEAETPDSSPSLAIPSQVEEVPVVPSKCDRALDLPVESETDSDMLDPIQVPKTYTEPDVPTKESLPTIKGEAEERDSRPFEIPSISITDDADNEEDYHDDQAFLSPSAEAKPKEKLQNAKSLLSSLVSIDVNVNEGRADKIIRRLSKTPEMISVTRTLRETSLQPESEDVWSSRRNSFYSEFDESGPVLEHIPSPEMLRSRRPSMRRDSETVIKETVVSTPSVAVRAEETAYSDHESDSDSDLEEGDDTIMQINISFEGLRQRIDSEKTSRSEERRRSVASMLDFSSLPEDPLQRKRSISECFSRRSSTTPGSDRLGSIDETMDLSRSFESEDFQIPEINVETDVEDTTDDNIQETVLEVADKVFVTVRSEKLTNTVSDISIKIAAKDLAPGLFPGLLGLPVPTLKPAGGAKVTPEEDKEENLVPEEDTSSTGASPSEEDTRKTEEILSEPDNEKDSIDNKDSDFTEKELTGDADAKVNVEKEEAPEITCEEGEDREFVPQSDDQGDSPSNKESDFTEKQLAGDADAKVNVEKEEVPVIICEDGEDKELTSESDKFEDLLNNKDSDFTQRELAEDGKAKVNVEKVELLGSTCEDGEERKLTSDTEDVESDTQMPPKEATEAQNIALQKQSEEEVILQVPDSSEQNTRLNSGDTVDKDEDNLQKPQSTDQTHNTFEQQESSLSLAQETGDSAILKDSDTVLDMSKRQELDTPEVSLLEETVSSIQIGKEEESFFDGGLTQGIFPILLVIVQHCLTALQVCITLVLQQA